MTKECRLLFRYHTRSAWRWLLFTWPFILFTISIVLFLMILVPSAFLRRLPILGEWPRMLELHGRVLVMDPVSGARVTVRGAVVEIGGYREVTDQDGRFQIAFVSPSIDDIPVLVRFSGQSDVTRVSFGPYASRRIQDFYLR